MSWQPSTIVAEEVLEHWPVKALASLFDDGTTRPELGSALPPLWHWVALPRWPASSQLGPDGHRQKGTFLPPVAQPRRMFAGGQVWFHVPVTVGSTVRRESSVESVMEKSGRSGPMVLVVIETRLYDDQGRLALEERQDLIYRDDVVQSGRQAPEPPPCQRLAGAPLRSTAPWAADLVTDPTILMRFSAASSNAHRIHYDWPYATSVEGYTGLVVHGPFVTLSLAEMLRLESPESGMSSLSHRNMRPLLCGQPARIRRLAGDSATLKLGLFPGDGANYHEGQMLTSLDVRGFPGP